MWKEWHENLWKLCFCVIASAAFTGLLFRLRLSPDFGNCYVISLVQMFVVPVIYAMDIFSGEMTNRTVHLLFKIPTPRWMTFFSKYLVSVAGMVMVFLFTSILMEVLSQGREENVMSLLKMNLNFSLAAVLLFTWFAAFGSQSRSEAGSLAAMFGVFVGWGIIFLWATMCNVQWPHGFVPYLSVEVIFENAMRRKDMTIDNLYIIKFFLSMCLGYLVAISIACYRYVKIRRYL